MTDKELKTIYEYMKSAGWLPPAKGYIRISRILDSNSAWEVVQEMERKGDWDSFMIHTNNQYTYSGDDFVTNKLIKWNFIKWNGDFFFWLMNPTNFFNCFAKWLEERQVTNDTI